ncbi:MULTISPECIES: NAD-dependent epimerase/dehydratase family protein [unclassified Oceanispirochaeta]|uniref:NAD-dependent epimerase/dehydratase family protein n=1 Tax=unclassified Oceanispirochaeta TaxID=2635722 RepID=UPI000E094ED4|nr:MULTISPECIES: NAD-dependent epimerase/dehydratase family protein [unclassified Oceanispirochaeta]MBF9017753.1 NAD-dependent epimerase/dehydratase family protein [Oceanispirochaeta sp. M2]NPD74317.1 NAD-dependent epimerase/dehydratase family protein [Oceanispirochaeta sp. M1]RDG29798.1 NAD-dependent epimerase/dehydratase family protein [Oceanispirochaeta sp. M1]
MKALITGYNGFIGRYLFDYLKKNNIEVDGISLSETNLEKINLKNYDSVVHLSGLAHQKKSTPYSEYKRINEDQSFHLALIAKRNGINHFIYFSSLKVYGDGDLFIKEDTECFPTDSYGKSKKNAEGKILSLQDTTFKVTILRVPLVYGPNPKANILLLLKLVNRCPILPFRGVENRRSIISIYNLSEIVRQVLKNQIEGILIPSDIRPVSTSDIIHYLSRARNKSNINFAIPHIIESLLKIVFLDKYKRLYMDFYVENTESLKRIDLRQLHESENDFIEFFKKN